MPQRVILLHAEAPPQPPPGAACNGCGVCCAAEPCPLGMLLSRRLGGACRALRWDEAEARYRCGAFGGRLPQRLVARWIGAGRGCDCTLSAQT